MMSQKGVFGYAAHAELQAHVLELPYGNEERLSMYLMLPRKGNDRTEIYTTNERLNEFRMFFRRKTTGCN